MTKEQFNLIMRALFLIIWFVGGNRKREHIDKLKNDYIVYMHSWE